MGGGRGGEKGGGRGGEKRGGREGEKGGGRGGENRIVYCWGKQSDRMALIKVKDKPLFEEL